MVYAEFGGQTECIMGNWKIENCEGNAAKGGGVLMSIMIPSCNAHAYMKFSKKHFAPYAKNATVKNIITINKYNVGMKSLDRAIIVSDTLKTETSPIFIS